MADRLEIEVIGFEFLSAIDRAASQLEKPGALMNLIGATMEENIALRFITKTDPNGNAWLPLAASTIKRKKGVGSILELSGHGKSSLGYNLGIDGSFVEIGFGESYMGYHETGTQRMPRRQLLTDDFNAGTLGAQDQADVLADIEAFLRDLGL